MKAAVVPAMSSSWQVKDVPQPQPGPNQQFQFSMQPESRHEPANTGPIGPCNNPGSGLVAQAHKFLLLVECLDRRRSKISRNLENRVLPILQILFDECYREVLVVRIISPSIRT